MAAMAEAAEVAEVAEVAGVVGVVGPHRRVKSPPLRAFCAGRVS